MLTPLPQHRADAQDLLDLHECGEKRKPENSVVCESSNLQGTKESCCCCCTM